MAKLPLDLSKFKKVATDKHTTTLKHEAGHEIKLAHHALSPKMREQLDKIPEVKKMSDGGPAIDPKKAKEVESGATKSGWQPEQWKKNVKEGLGLAKGGQIESGAASQGWPNHQPRLKGNNKAIEHFDQNFQYSEGQYADGGMIDAIGKENYSDDEDENNPKLAESKKVPPEHEKRAMYANGTEEGGAKSEDVQEDSNNKPVTVNVNTPQPQETIPYKVGNALRTGASNVAGDVTGAIKQVTSPIVNGVQNFAQGLAAGQSAPSVQQEQQDAAQTKALGNQPTLPPAAAEEEKQEGVNPVMQAQEDASKATLGAYGEQLKGLNDEAKAKGKLGNELAYIHQKAIDQQQNIQEHYQFAEDKIQNEQNALINDVKTNHINPNHYFENLSTWDRISNIIGLTLGGIGTARGGPNVALDLLKTYVNHDIEAQKANMEQKNNMVSMYSKMLGDKQQGAKMAEIAQANIIAHEVDKQTALAQTPLEKARLLQLRGQIGVLAAQEQSKLSMMHAITSINMGNQATNGASTQEADRVGQQIAAMRSVNPQAAQELEKRYVPGIGLASVSLTPDNRNLLLAHQQLGDAAKELLEWSKKHSGSLDPRVINEGKAKAAELQSLYRNAIRGGVFKPGEQAFIEHIITKDPAQFFSKMRSVPALKAVIESNEKKFTGLKKSLGFSKSASQPQLTEREQSYVDFAKKNPNDPRSPILLKKLGIK